MRLPGLVPIAVVLALTSVTAADWPRRTRPHQKRRVHAGPPLLETWPTGGPRVVWRKAVGQGLSGPVVADGRRDPVSPRRAIGRWWRPWTPKTGNTLWKYDYPTAYRDDFGFDEGPARGAGRRPAGSSTRSAPKGSCTRSIWRRGSARVERGHDEALPGARRASSAPPARRSVEDGRVIANVGGAEAGIVGVRRDDRHVCVDRHRRRRELLLAACWRYDQRSEGRGVPDPERHHRSRARHRRVCCSSCPWRFAVRRIRQRRHAARRRRPDVHLR